MNKLAKKIFVLIKVTVPKSNEHMSSVLQFGLNTSVNLFSALAGVQIQQDRFGVEPELTASGS